MGPPSSGQAAPGAGLRCSSWGSCKPRGEPGTFRDHGGGAEERPSPGRRVRSPAPDPRGQGMGGFGERGPGLSWVGHREAVGPEQGPRKQRLDRLDVSSVQRV